MVLAYLKLPSRTQLINYENFIKVNLIKKLI